MQRFRDRLETSLQQVRGGRTDPHLGRDRRRRAAADGCRLPHLRGVEPQGADHTLNRWLKAMSERHPPPMVQGRRLRLRYLTQTKIRPPTFQLFLSRPDALPDDYGRYIVNGLREDFAIPSVPIRLVRASRTTHSPTRGRARTSRGAGRPAGRRPPTGPAARPGPAGPRRTRASGRPVAGSIATAGCGPPAASRCRACRARPRHGRWCC